METNDRTLSVLKKYGELLLANGKKMIIEMKDGTHATLYPNDDTLILSHLLYNTGAINFATANTDKPEIYVPCGNNKELKEILETLEY